MTRALLLALTLAFAGCVAPAAAPTQAPAADAAAAPVIATDCQQVHSFFPSPAEPFRSFVPEGFTLITSGPLDAIVDVRIEASACAEGSEVWVELPVEPPAALADNEAMHFVPVVAYVDREDLLARYQAWGVEAVIEGSIALAAAGGGAYELRVDTPDESYVWRGALDEGSGAFEAWRGKRWIPADEGVAGAIVREQTEAQNVGLGAVSMVYRGGGGSPPAHAGIVHVIEAVEIATTLEAIL